MHDPASLLLAAYYMLGFPGGSDGKESACSVGDLDSIPGSGRSPGEGNGNLSSIFAWRIPWMEEPGGYSPWGCKESDITEQVTLLDAQHRARHFTHTTLFNPHNAR